CVESEAATRGLYDSRRRRSQASDSAPWARWKSRRVGRPGGGGNVERWTKKPASAARTALTRSESASRPSGCSSKTSHGFGPACRPGVEALRVLLGERPPATEELPVALRQRGRLERRRRQRRREVRQRVEDPFELVPPPRQLRLVPVDVLEDERDPVAVVVGE